MSCALSASFHPFPPELQLGGLHLDASGARWAPGTRLHGGGEFLPVPIRVQGIREVVGDEKRRVKARFFQVIETATSMGPIRLAVPRDSVALVVERLSVGA